jgi:Tol biopolymer transport system component
MKNQDNTKEVRVMRYAIGLFLCLMGGWFLIGCGGSDPPSDLALRSPELAKASKARIVFSSNRDGNYEIYAMELDGLPQCRLTMDPQADFTPAWSSNRSQIAFARGSYDGQFIGDDAEIWVMKSDGTRQKRLTNNDVADFGPAWSPNRKKIAFTRSRWDIWVMNANGSGEIQLTDDPDYDMSPAWSPDGLKIAFQSTRDTAPGDRWQIYTMDPDGFRVLRLTIDDGALHEAPAWSPDGRLIALTYQKSAALQIAVMKADGTGLTPLTDGSANDMYPSWLADGSKIIFQSDRDGNLEIYSMNPNGSNQTRLSWSAPTDEFPNGRKWDPFGRVANELGTIWGLRGK